MKAGQKMDKKNQLYQYVHLPENEDIGPEDRTYQAQEKIVEYNGRKVLCLIVEANAVTCCDGSYSSQIKTIHVKGYITRWKYRIDESGEAISEIEQIDDWNTQQEVRGILKRNPC